MNPKSQRYSRYFTYIKPVIKLPIIRTYGTTIFTFFIITFFIFYAIKPTVETILVLQKKLADSTAVLEKVNQKTKDLSQGKANFENLNPSLKSKIENLLPNTVNLKSVIQTLEQSAKLHQASVSALQIQPLVIDNKTDNKPDTLTQVEFTFNVEGEYKNLISILQDLKSSARLISIDNLSLASGSEGSGLIMSVSGKAYYFK